MEEILKQMKLRFEIDGKEVNVELGPNFKLILDGPLTVNLESPKKNE